LFVVTDAKRNYYTNPDLVNDGIIFQNYVNKFAGPTYKPEPVVNITYFDEYRVSNVTHWTNIQT